MPRNVDTGSCFSQNCLLPDTENALPEANKDAVFQMVRHRCARRRRQRSWLCVSESCLHLKSMGSRICITFKIFKELVYVAVSDLIGAIRNITAGAKQFFGLRNAYIVMIVQYGFSCLLLENSGYMAGTEIDNPGNTLKSQLLPVIAANEVYNIIHSCTVCRRIVCDTFQGLQKLFVPDRLEQYVRRTRPKRINRIVEIGMIRQQDEALIRKPPNEHSRIHTGSGHAHKNNIGVPSPDHIKTKVSVSCKTGDIQWQLICMQTVLHCSTGIQICIDDHQMSQRRLLSSVCRITQPS